ncbi:MAG: GYD domain-containing protein [Actinomycetota bacterium]
MPKYLWRASYSAEGAKGVLKEGGTGRREAVEKVLADVGGTLEAFYFGFGEDDAIAIVELPDHVTAAAVSLAVGSTGMVNVKTTVLLTPEEIDRAAKTSIAYRGPGK